MHLGLRTTGAKAVAVKARRSGQTGEGPRASVYRTWSVAWWEVREVLRMKRGR